MVVAAPNHKEYLDKHEKEAVNLVARASGEGRAMVRPSNDNGSDAASWDMTSREREICSKFVKLIQYHPSKEVKREKDNENVETPSGQGDRLIADALANSSQHE